MSAAIDASSSWCVQAADLQTSSDSENKSNSEKVFTVKENGQTCENVKCFVCDATVHGRRYALATCKTQNSRTRVIEKLGQLVGERYVVVISEDDVICRSCANLINTLDRLECEMKGVKSAVLRFLEEKYSLAEGELINCSQVTRLGQPPQVTRSQSSKTDNNISRKRSARRMDEENCLRKHETSKRSDYWMRCDKCCYTTPGSTFFARHTRQPSRKKMFSDKNLVLRETSVELENPDDEPRAIQTAALEIVDLSGSNEDPDKVVWVPVNTEPSVAGIKEEQIQLVNLANQGTLQFQNFLATGRLFQKIPQEVGSRNHNNPNLLKFDDNILWHRV